MRFYFQFLFCLVIGLVGLCAAFKILFDTLFSDWDPVADLHEAVRSGGRRESFGPDWRPQIRIAEDES